jgi:hypothetical protein
VAPGIQGLGHGLHIFEIVLDVSTLDERTLGYMNELGQPWHQTVREHLGEEFPEYMNEQN